MPSLLKQAHQQGLPSVQTLVQRPMGNAVQSPLPPTPNPHPRPALRSPRLPRCLEAAVSQRVTVDHSQTEGVSLTSAKQHFFCFPLFNFFNVSSRGQRHPPQMSSDNSTNVFAPLPLYLPAVFAEISEFLKCLIELNCLLASQGH